MALVSFKGGGQYVRIGCAGCTLSPPLVQEKSRGGIRGNPWINSNGGPLPPRTPWMVIEGDTETSIVWKVVGNSMIAC